MPTAMIGLLLIFTVSATAFAGQYNAGKYAVNGLGASVFSTGPQRGFMGCFYNWRWYSQGDVFPAGDGCNNCICHGNNRVACTLMFCLCNRPRDTGPCYAAFQRWWYNKATNDCQPFIYGGCQGNENNFETRQACLQRCRRRRY